MARGIVPRNSREMEARTRALHALAMMRHGASISHAARDNEVSARTIKRYAGAALIQDRPGGRIRASKSDRLIRYLQIPGPNGPVDINVRGSKAAAEVARYKAAVNRLLHGDRDALKDWHGKKIAGIPLITDTKTLVEQAHLEMLPYSLYRSSQVVQREEAIESSVSGLSETVLLRKFERASATSLGRAQTRALAVPPILPEPASCGSSPPLRAGRNRLPQNEQQTLGQIQGLKA